MYSLPDEIFSIILPFLNNQYNFSISCKRFNKLVRQYIIPSDIQVYNTFNLCWCLPNITIKYIINHKKSNLAIYDNIPIKYAIIHGKYQIVKMLLADERINPINNNLIYLATIHKQYNILKLLLKDKRIDPCENNMIAFYHALAKENVKLLKILCKKISNK